MKLLALLIAAVLIPVVLAESSIYSETATTDTDISTSAGIFSLKYDEVSNKVFAQTPTTNLIVDNGACKSNDVFKICINSANFSSRDENFKSYYDVNVDIYKLTESLETSITAAKNTVLQNEQNDILIALKNPTNIDATNIELLIDMLNFTVTNVKGCTLSGNSMVWKGSLQANYPKDCEATLASADEGTYSLSGSVSYFNGFDKQNDSISALSITVLPDQVKISEFYGNTTDLSNLETDDSFYLNFSLQNIHDSEEADVSLEIALPANSYLLNKPQLSAEGNKLKKFLILKPGVFFNYSLYFRASIEGTSSLDTSMEYSIQNINNNYEKSAEIIIKEPRPSIELIPEYDTLLPWQKFIVSARISNPSLKYRFSDIIARLNVPYNMEIEETLESLGPNESSTIISRIFLLPSHAAAGNLPISIELTYKLGVFAKSQNKSITLKVNGSSDQIADETLSNSSAEATQDTAAAPVDEDSESAQAAKNGTKRETVVDSFFPKKKALWVGLSILIVILFVFPIILYMLKKKQPPQQVLQQPEQQSTPPQNPPQA